MTEVASEKGSSTPSGEKDPSPDETVARAAAGSADGDADGAAAPADVPRPPRVSPARALGSPKPPDAAPPSGDRPGGTVPPPPEPAKSEAERELRDESTATEPDAPRPPAPSDELDQQATLRQAKAAADADQANTTTRRRAPSADRTAAITPYVAEQLAAPPPAPAPPPPHAQPAPTAQRLHEEDEEGPTLIAAYPAAKPDDEATELMPSILQAPGQPVPPPVSSSRPASQPPSAIPPSLRQPHPLHAQLAEREAAVQAALAAAAGLGHDPEARAAQRTQRIEMAIVAVLGTAVVLSALVSIAAQAALHMPVAVALFVAGIASIQRVEKTKLILLGLSGLVLFGTLVALALA